VLFVKRQSPPGAGTAGEPARGMDLEPLPDDLQRRRTSSEYSLRNA